MVESGRREGKKLMIQKRRRIAELVVGIGACTGGRGLDREKNR